MDLTSLLNKIDSKKAALAGLVLAGFYWAMFFNNGASFDAEIEKARQTIQRNQSSREQVKLALADKGKFEDEIQNITLNMRDFQKYFSVTIDSNGLQAKVSEAAENRGLIVNNLKPAKRDNEFSNYSETAVAFRVEGPFHNIMQFVSDMTKMDKVIDFSVMKFITKEPGEVPSVELDTILVMYNSSEVVDE